MSTNLDHVAELHIPDTITIGGTECPVRRAWPAGPGRTAWEAVHSDLGIRAGYLDESGLRLLEADSDPKLPGLAGLLEASGRLVSHRPGKRAVVQLPDGSFAKCVREGRADDVLTGQRRAEGFIPGFALPQVLRSDSSTVVLSVVPGAELHDPAALGADWAQAWAEALDAWAKAGPRPGSEPGSGLIPGFGPASQSMVPVHDPAAEVEVLKTWRDRALPVLAAESHSDAVGTRPDTLLVDLGELDELIGEVAAELTGGHSTERATEDIGLIHRDLHDKQIMWDPVAGPGLLDVDTACRGERALDLGNLRAHARWRTEQNLWTPAQAAVVIDEIGRTASAAGIDPERVRVYERATLIRLACVYAFRPAWRNRTGWLLDTARSLQA